MKISIITVCLNSEDTILHTLNSVLTQTYDNIEHIIVDGGSTDRTRNFLQKYNFKRKKIIFKKKLSLYNSINLGIKESSGDIITILHSDDIYNRPNTIESVIKKIKKSKKKIFLGDVIYYKNDFKNIIRYYSSKNFRISLMKFGFMPPHTGSFYRKKVFKNIGYYKNFKIAGDFEHMLRAFYKKKYEFEILNIITTRMRTGGLSSKNLKSYVVINRELMKSFQINNIKNNYFLILLRIPSKIIQFFNFNKNKINSRFFVKKSTFFNKYNEDKIKLIQNIKSLNFQKNFILSALNLAFLGSYSQDKIKLHKNMINWPDGIFSKVYNRKIKKIPGREILQNLKIPKYIKRIVIIGNLTANSKIYLRDKFKINIINYQLPFGTIDEIKRKTNYHLNSTDLVFITLPTPKQEQIAHHLSIANKHFKIICIGGSIGIVSGDERPVPRLLINLEFFWRLRYETKRRSIRLLSTFFHYILDYIFTGKLKHIKIKFIQ